MSLRLSKLGKRFSMPKTDFAQMIVDKRHTIEKIYVVIIILSLICIPFVKINYDLTKYLPDSTSTKQGLDLMKEEFAFPGTAQIMINDVSIYEAKNYKEQIQAIEGVDTVMWCDNLGGIYQAESFINFDSIDEYYRENSALMDITFIGDDAADETDEALTEIENLVGDKGYIIGQAMQNKFLKETIFNEVSVIMVLLVVLLIIILSISTNSWLEPFLFLSVMCIAVILNKGSDILIGEVSFLTFAISAILQLAVATDYAVFLFHAFARNKNKGYEATEAMVHALRESTKSILSSGLTTFIGFLVISFMELRLGYDLGLSMAKGILICMICIITLMPALILRGYKWIDKMSHRPFLPKFVGTSITLYRAKSITFIAIVVLIIPMYFAQNIMPFTFGMDSIASSEGSKYYENEKAIQSKFGSSSMLAIIAPKSDLVTERQLSDELETLPYVKSVTSLAGMLPEGVPVSALPKSISSQMHSDEYFRIIMYVATGKSEGENEYAAIYEIEEMLQVYYPEDAYIVGGIPTTMDMEKVLTEDYPKINQLSILGILLVMAISFQSILLAVIALIPIESAIIFNMATPYFTGESIMYLGMIMVTCVQLGATVDYAILLCNTYFNKRKEQDKKTAAIETIQTCIPTVLTSGLIMFFVGYTVKFITTVSVLKDLGGLIGLGGILSMLFVLILMPALLTMFDHWILKEAEIIEEIKQTIKKAYNKKGLCLQKKYLKLKGR